MLKLIAIAAATVACMAPSKKAENAIQTSSSATLPSIYQFKVTALEGGTIDFSTFKGKKILVVNTASECGYTPQYKGLEELYEKYKNKLVIVGFPANNFGGQEPGSNADIRKFCTDNYSVSFPMAAKISVKGDDMAPIYHWLTSKSENGVLDASISWNFNKFLLDENGHLLAYFPSKVTPMSDEIISKL
ncbi:MAG: glutathione peroxidase [Bacteroidetes bacterium]|nr:glutathione peroxidase [Bacteroidota bacterium]MBS1755953.1 glutathione peroxidase [Bacteroidota bacterium]